MKLNDNFRQSIEELETELSRGLSQQAGIDLEVAIDLNISCKECGYSLSLANALETAERLKNSEKDIGCSECGLTKPFDFWNES